jgi:hypothetical protein
MEHIVTIRGLDFGWKSHDQLTGVELKMAKVDRVSNEWKNLNRLTGEFLVASRLTQSGYMVSLQWGTAISYDILAFDKLGNVAYIEVKSSAAYAGRWLLQSKYAHPREDTIPVAKRFVCCVDMSKKDTEPSVYVFPASVVEQGLNYSYNRKFSKSSSYRLSLDSKPRGKSKQDVLTVGLHINAAKYLKNFAILGLTPVPR